MTGLRIGLFGGSFNPPHMGHTLAVHYALARWNLDMVLVASTFRHPFGKPLEDFQHRVAMCQRAFACLAQQVRVSTIEADLGGTSYTVQTVRELRRRAPATDFFLIIGSDLARESDGWHEIEALRQLAPPLVIPRAGQSLTSANDPTTGACLPEISSTEVRELLAHDPTWTQSDAAAHWLGREVAHYIADHGLYNQLRKQSTS